MPTQQMLLGGGKPLTTENLTSESGTWTAPSGVTSVNLTLIGSEDHPADWHSTYAQVNFYYPASTPVDYPNESPTQASAKAAVEAWLVNWRSIAGTGTAERTVSGSWNTTATITHLDGSTSSGVSITDGSGRFYGTTTATFSGVLPATITGNVGFGQGVGNWAYKYVYGISFQANAQAGGASTFGSYSAAGASIGGSATTLQQTISVTPGQSYSYGRHRNLRNPPYQALYGTVKLEYFA